MVEGRWLRVEGQERAEDHPENPVHPASDWRQEVGGVLHVVAAGIGRPFQPEVSAKTSTSREPLMVTGLIMGASLRCCVGSVNSSHAPFAQSILHQIESELADFEQRIVGIIE